MKTIDQVSKLRTFLSTLQKRATKNRHESSVPWNRPSSASWRISPGRIATGASSCTARLNDREYSRRTRSRERATVRSRSRGRLADFKRDDKCFSRVFVRALQRLRRVQIAQMAALWRPGQLSAARSRSRERRNVRFPHSHPGFSVAARPPREICRVRAFGFAAKRASASSRCPRRKSPCVISCAFDTMNAGADQSRARAREPRRHVIPTRLLFF